MLHKFNIYSNIVLLCRNKFSCTFTFRTRSNYATGSRGKRRKKLRHASHFTLEKGRKFRDTRLNGRFFYLEIFFLKSHTYTRAAFAVLDVDYHFYRIEAILEVTLYSIFNSFLFEFLQFKLLQF